MIFTQKSSKRFYIESLAFSAKKKTFWCNYISVRGEKWSLKSSQESITIKI